MSNDFNHTKDSQIAVNLPVYINMQTRYTGLLVGILILLMFLYWLGRTGRSTINQTETQFAVRDTAFVEAIELAEFTQGKNERSLRLSRTGGGWKVNQFDAQPGQIEMILSTLYNIQVREPVDPRAKENVMNFIKEKHIRVTVERKDQDPLVYYIGPATPDTKGTMAILQGAENPYIVAFAGLEGYLAPRYSTDLDSWRENIIFNFNPAEITSVNLQYAGSDSSFKLIRQGNGWILATGEPVDTAAAGRYIRKFGKISAQTFLNKYMPKGLDSLRQLRPPDVTLTLTTNTDSRTLVLYYRPDNVDLHFGWISGTQELLAVQRFVIDKFLIHRKNLMAVAK